LHAEKLQNKLDQIEAKMKLLPDVNLIRIFGVFDSKQDFK
jgi:hypothetical protein